MMTEKLSTNGLVHPEDIYYSMDDKEPIRFLDATFMVQGGRTSPQQAYFERHIEGAQFFDIDVVADQQARLPHTLPRPEYFASCVESMGISNGDHVVIYDQSGVYMASSRAWWMFRVFGHENVYVMEGGLEEWIIKGFKIISGPSDAPTPGKFIATYRPDLVVTKDALLANIDGAEMTVLDARPAQRFSGDMPEPRPGMKAGHIPGSLNLPFPDVLERQTGGFKDKDHLENILNKLGVMPDTKTAVTCGSGVTACTLALALYKMRGQNAAVYDGSWSEWGDEAEGTPVEVCA